MSFLGTKLLNVRKLQNSPLVFCILNRKLLKLCSNDSAAPRQLTFLDLYVAIVVALIYMVFYLVELDGKGGVFVCAFLRFTIEMKNLCLFPLHFDEK